jgi:DNA-binding NtrC family response regulator
MSDRGSVLIVDDEPNAVRVLSAILKEAGYHVLESMSADGAISLIGKGNVDAVITDVKMPAKDGFHLFQYVSDHHPEIPVMFLTAYGTVESAVNAMTSGAYYYFIKPPDYPKLMKVLAKAIETHAAKKKLDSLKRSGAHKHISVHPIVGTSPAIVKIINTIETVKNAESSVLIQGDTGTGKEVIASNLHYRGKRSGKPFVAVNCAAIPRDLIEAELFGYEKGAFTGATTSRVGKFEEAEDGTMFLDEIGELELSVQAKLLRVLQEREIVRLGTNRKKRVRFRLVSSTNKELRTEVEAGRFREDLFYRLNVVEIRVPPLRERQQDVPILSLEFLKNHSLRENRMFTFSDDVLELFMMYEWPGNVRQLSNIIERAVVMAGSDQIGVQDLPEELLASRRQSPTSGPVKSLKALERQAISEALLLYQGNKSKAARTLGISRKTFYKRLKDMP